MWEASSLKALKALCGHVLCRYCTLTNLFCMTPQRHRRSLEKTSGEKTPNWSRLRACHLPSHALVFTSLFFLICLHLSSVRVIFCVVLLVFGSVFLVPFLPLIFSVFFSAAPAYLFYPWLSSHSFSLSFSADCPHIHSFMLACSLKAVAGVLPGAWREQPGLSL